MNLQVCSEPVCVQPRGVVVSSKCGGVSELMAWCLLAFGMDGGGSAGVRPSTCSAPGLWLCCISLECVFWFMFLLDTPGYFPWLPCPGTV